MAELYDEGDWRSPTLAVSPFDGTTVATLEIEAPDGTTDDPTPTTLDGGENWAAPAYELTAAGEWIERWHVIGAGKGKERTVVRVAPDPGDLLTERVYATTT